MCHGNNRINGKTRGIKLPIREPSQITFAFRGGLVVRKMLDLLHKKCKLGGGGGGGVIYM
jgi:hypothetical protein